MNAIIQEEKIICQEEKATNKGQAQEGNQVDHDLEDDALYKGKDLEDVVVLRDLQA